MTTQHEWLEKFLAEQERQVKAEELAQNAHEAARQAAMEAKYQPRVVSGRGQGLEMSVEMSENPSTDEFIEAMTAAARKAGLL